ncbi:MAG: acetyl-CoA decarbonylase/synthase complex subunit gamma [Candidatus Omnitrophica bacterium]|nr:acetyl-CoA decarbonylase/synthase complex subunit gamma [Candidatus Omnitrophota bacterium]
MALSGLDIYKLLPKTNCRQCGFATCLAFAMQLAKKTVSIDKCPFLSPEAKIALEASSQPPIKLITIGVGENKLEIGNETVLFRHEEKFHHPCGIGFIIEDDLQDAAIREALSRINKLTFERVGQKLDVNLVAVKQKKDKERFVKATQLIMQNTELSIVLMSRDNEALGLAARAAQDKKPLLFPQTFDNIDDISKIAQETKCPLVVRAKEIDTLSQLTTELNKRGITDLVLDTQDKPVADKIWDLTQIRRLALKKSMRSLGFPTIAVVDNPDPYEETMEAATYISKYAGIVLIKGNAPWQALSLLTLRQNIYTDPQKPLQIEPKLYPIGQASEKSPLLVTTNFSLSYYTVMGEVEACKIPSYILSVDTEGMSVLTAWAAEKFNAEKIKAAMDKCAVSEAVSHKRIIIPGYVAVMSGDLQDQSGWEVIVGPKEAAGIPSFLKNLQ